MKIRDDFVAHIFFENLIFCIYFLFENQFIALSALVIQGMRPTFRAGRSGGSSLGQRPATSSIMVF